MYQIHYNAKENISETKYNLKIPLVVELNTDNTICGMAYYKIEQNINKIVKPHAVVFNHKLGHSYSQPARCPSV